MLHPGDVIRCGEQRGTFRFRPRTGELELALAEQASRGSTPARVTAVLAAALAELGGEPASPGAVGELCVADRQYLMHRLADHLGFASHWLTETCVACHEPFNLLIEPSSLPVKPGVAGHPFAEAPTSQGTSRLRLPTGADQECLVDLDGEEAVRALLDRCLVRSEGARTIDLSRLSEDELAAIDAALEAIAPAVTTRVETTCPACHQRNVVDVNPYFLLDHLPSQILDEVHALAMAYHWNEHEILTLPTPRRREYLARIERESGMTQ